jgi:cellulose synthase/poly-beta-1,6-N-acetylglucosamine synthase-like glycosyltransferase
MPELIFMVAVFLYFSFIFLFSVGIRKKYPRINYEDLQTVTVIVAARNEEKNIESCLISLSNLIYPKGKLEIIIVDDLSGDRTGKIIDEFIKDKPLFKKIIPDKNSSLKGKVNAVASAIKKAAGEIILLTDADCEVSVTWAITLASYYKKDVGLVNGFTIFKNGNIFSAIQGIDLVFLLSAASGSINLKYPVSCIGNNMSFRKEAYIETGGYEHFPFSVTEDFTLLQGISGLRKYKIIYPLLKESIVVSKPSSGVNELISQKKRWGRGGFVAPVGGFLIMGIAFVTNLLVLLTPLFFSPVWLYLAVFKIIVDYLFLYPVHAILGVKNQLKYYLFFQVYFILYTTILPLILIFSRKISWKGRNY